MKITKSMLANYNFCVYRRLTLAELLKDSPLLESSNSFNNYPQDDYDHLPIVFFNVLSKIMQMSPREYVENWVRTLRKHEWITISVIEGYFARPDWNNKYICEVKLDKKYYLISGKNPKFALAAKMHSLKPLLLSDKYFHIFDRGIISLPKSYIVKKFWESTLQHIKKKQILESSQKFSQQETKVNFWNWLCTDQQTGENVVEEYINDTYLYFDKKAERRKSKENRHKPFILNEYMDLNYIRPLLDSEKDPTDVNKYGRYIGPNTRTQFIPKEVVAVKNHPFHFEDCLAKSDGRPLLRNGTEAYMTSKRARARARRNGISRQVKLTNLNKLTVDVDGVTPKRLVNLLEVLKLMKLEPRYISSSGNGAHITFSLSKNIPLFINYKKLSRQGKYASRQSILIEKVYEMLTWALSIPYVTSSTVDNSNGLHHGYVTPFGVTKNYLDVIELYKNTVEVHYSIEELYNRVKEWFDSMNFRLMTYDVKNSDLAVVKNTYQQYFDSFPLYNLSTEDFKVLDFTEYDYQQWKETQKQIIEVVKPPKRRRFDPSQGGRLITDLNWLDEYIDVITAPDMNRQTILKQGVRKNVATMIAIAYMQAGVRNDEELTEKYYHKLASVPHTNEFTPSDFERAIQMIYEDDKWVERNWNVPAYEMFDKFFGSALANKNLVVEKPYIPQKMTEHQLKVWEKLLKDPFLVFTHSKIALKKRFKIGHKALNEILEKSGISTDNVDLKVRYYLQGADFRPYFTFKKHKTVCRVDDDKLIERLNLDWALEYFNKNRISSIVFEEAIKQYKQDKRHNATYSVLNERFYELYNGATKFLKDRNVYLEVMELAHRRLGNRELAEKARKLKEYKVPNRELFETKQKRYLMEKELSVHLPVELLRPLRPITMRERENWQQYNHFNEEKLSYFDYFTQKFHEKGIAISLCPRIVGDLTLDEIKVHLPLTWERIKALKQK